VGSLAVMVRAEGLRARGPEHALPRRLRTTTTLAALSVENPRSNNENQRQQPTPSVTQTGAGPLAVVARFVRGGSGRGPDVAAALPRLGKSACLPVRADRAVRHSPCQVPLALADEQCAGSVAPVDDVEWWVPEAALRSAGERGAADLHGETRAGAQFHQRRTTVRLTRANPGASCRASRALTLVQREHLARTCGVARAVASQPVCDCSAGLRSAARGRCLGLSLGVAAVRARAAGAPASRFCACSKSRCSAFASLPLSRRALVTTVRRSL
jgi:hypothetical protein